MEVNDFYAEMEDLDSEAKLKAGNTNIEVVEIEPEKIYTTSIKSKVNPAKDMTLNVAISENAKEICSQENMG